MKVITLALITMALPVYADLGLNYPIVSDSQAEHDAKAGAAALGVTTIFDHPTQAPNASFYVPIVYNRLGDPAAGEQDPNSPKNTTDIDYVPLSQLKGKDGVNGTPGVKGDKGEMGVQGVAGVTGLTGSAGANGTNGATGATGAKGNQGNTGATGPQGIQGPKGDSADVPAIDPRLDVEIREYDSEHWSISSFASFGMQSSTARYIVGQKLTLKLGQSYEAKEIQKLRNEIRDANLKMEVIQ